MKEDITSSGSIGSRALPDLVHTPCRCTMNSGRDRTKR